MHLRGWIKCHHLEYLDNLTLDKDDYGNKHISVVVVVNWLTGLCKCK